MIIQIAGTNGAGKSTVVRAVMAAGQVEAAAGGYLLQLPRVIFPVFIVGSYEASTGGCDTIHDLVEAHSCIREAVLAGQAVLFEGAGHTMNQTRGPRLLEELLVPFYVVLLTTSLGACLNAINQRRAARGQHRPVDETITRGNHRRAQNYAARMRDAGAQIIRASREEAPDRVLELLRGGV